MRFISLKFFCSLSQNAFLLYLLSVLSFNCVVVGLIDSDSCNDNMNIKTKIDMSNLVISGTIEKLNSKSVKNGMYDCEVLVGQVFKEDDRVPPNLMVDSDSMVTIKGFGSTEFCNSEVEPKDTKLFFLKTTAKAYKLIAGILPITFSNLKHITAVSKGQKYMEPNKVQARKNPCDSHFCAFGAECHLNNTTMKPYCRCIDKCNDIFSPVCGSDLVSYTNECNLKMSSCLKKKRIKVLIAQACGAFPMVQNNHHSETGKGYFKTSSTMIFRHCRRCWTTAKVRHFYKIRNRNRNLEVAVTVSRSIA